MIIFIIFDQYSGCLTQKLLYSGPKYAVRGARSAAEQAPEPHSVHFAGDSRERRDQEQEPLWPHRMGIA